MDGNLPLAGFVEGMCLRHAGDLSRLPRRGFLRHKQANGKVQRRGLRRSVTEGSGVPRHRNRLRLTCGSTEACEHESSMTDNSMSSGRRRFLAMIGLGLALTRTGAEQVAGTDPRDPNSVFKASTDLRPAPAGGLVIQWASAAGRNYAVHRATDLAGGFTPLATGIPGTPPLNQFTDADATGSGPYFFLGDPDRSMNGWASAVPRSQA